MGERLHSRPSAGRQQSQNLLSSSLHFARRGRPPLQFTKVSQTPLSSRTWVAVPKEGVTNTGTRCLLPLGWAELHTAIPPPPLMSPQLPLQLPSSLHRPGQAQPIPVRAAGRQHMCAGAAGRAGGRTAPFVIDLPPKCLEKGETLGSPGFSLCNSSPETSLGPAQSKPHQH